MEKRLGLSLGPEPPLLDRQSEKKEEWEGGQGHGS